MWTISRETPCINTVNQNYPVEHNSERIMGGVRVFLISYLIFCIASVNARPKANGNDEFVLGEFYAFHIKFSIQVLKFQVHIFRLYTHTHAVK